MRCDDQTGKVGKLTFVAVGIAFVLRFRFRNKAISGEAGKLVFIRLSASWHQLAKRFNDPHDIRDVRIKGEGYVRPADALSAASNGSTH